MRPEKFPTPGVCLRSLVSIVVASCLLFSACSHNCQRNVEAPSELTSEEFALELDVRTYEQSLDSNARHYVIAVNDQLVHYQGPWGEGVRGNFPRETVQFRLSSDQRRELEETLKRQDLLTDVDDHSGHVDDTGVAVIHGVEIDATIVVDGERYEVHIDGPTGGYPDEAVEAIDSRKKARALVRLCDEIWRWAKESGAGP